VTMTMERNPASPVVSYSDSTSDMSARQLREYIAALTDTAERREVEMSETEAAEIVKATWISSGAERSPFAETIRVRVALRRLLEAGHHRVQLGGTHYYGLRVHRQSGDPLRRARRESEPGSGATR